MEPSSNVKDMELTTPQPTEVSTGRRFMAATVVSLGAMGLVAGCGGSEPESSRPSNIEATSPETQPPTTEEVQPEPERVDCTVIPTPNYPRSRLKPENADSIEKHMDVIWKAKSPGEEVTLRDIGNATAIIANSLVDGVYAEALVFVSNSQMGPLNAEFIINRQYSGEDADCMTSAQLQNTDQLYDLLVDGLGPKAGQQISASARAAYEAFKSKYQDFKQDYLGSTS